MNEPEQQLQTSKPDRYKASSFRAFNTKWPDRYDGCWWLRIFRVDDWDRAIIAALQASKPALPILDVGCATGRLLVQLAEHGASHVCGVDIAPQILEKADEKLRHLGVRYELSIADAEESLPFANGSFGAVVLSGVIHHFFRPRDALAEIERVLSPQGRLYVIEPRFPPLVRPLLNGYLRLFSHDGDCRFHSPRKLAALLSECGFAPGRVPVYPGRFSYMIVAHKGSQTEQPAQPPAAADG